MAEQRSGTVVGELSESLLRFVGGQESADTLLRTVARYLTQNPAEFPAVRDWIHQGAASGRMSSAVRTMLEGQLERSEHAATLMRPIAGPAAQTSSTLPSARPSPGHTAGVLGPGVVLKQRFTLVSELGQGGMGTVFKARDRNKELANDRNPFVAVKILSADFEKHPDSFIALQREARRAQTLAHPNVITVYDFDRDDPHTFMTMEYLEGLPLDVWIHSFVDQQLPFEHRWKIIRGVAAALAYGHDKGVVHSDLKPSNIFVCTSGAIKVLDFGISRPMRLDSSALSDTLFDPAKRLGGLTPAYASLEQWSDSDPDPRDDVYSFGCVTYELFGGRHPFAHASAKDAANSALVPRRIEGLTRRQWRALTEALAFNRSDRLASIEEFIDQFAPVGFLRKYRMPLAVAGGSLLVAGMYFGYGYVSDYVEDRTIEVQSAHPRAARAAPLTVDQLQEINDTLTLARGTLKQAVAADTVDDLVYLVSEGANNLNQMLDSVQDLDPANANAQSLRVAAAQLFADKSRQLLKQGDAAKALLLVNYGLKLVPDSGALFRLKRDVMEKCNEAAATCDSR